MTLVNRLQDRDLILFRYLFRMKVATILQIERDIPYLKGRAHLNRRLNFLHSKQYVRKNFYTRKAVYSLGKYGIHYLKDTNIIPKAYKEVYLGFNPEQIRHDLILNDCVDLLTEQSGREAKVHSAQVSHPRRRVEVLAQDRPVARPDKLYTKHNRDPEYSKM